MNNDKIKKKNKCYISITLSPLSEKGWAIDYYRMKMLLLKDKNINTLIYNKLLVLNERLIIHCHK